MKKKWKKLAADMLDEASDMMSNKSCNDWDFPKDWTKKEQQEFVKAYHMYNSGNLKEYDPENPWLGDNQVAGFLAAIMKQEAEK